MRKGAWAVIAVLIGFGASADAQSRLDRKWHWVWVEPDFNSGWTTFEGDAAVVQSGDRFQATLNGISPQAQPTLRLEGVIRGRTVTATGTLVGTDAAPERYTGTIERLRTKLSDPSKGWGYDRIQLTGQGNFVGLYRAGSTR